MNKLGKRVLTGLLTVPVALSMPISVSAYALEDGSDEILVAAAESAEIVYDAVAVADDATEATGADVVADVMAAVENSEAGVVAMAADVPVAVAEEATADALKIAATIAPKDGDATKGYDESLVSVSGDTVTVLQDFALYKTSVTIYYKGTIDLAGRTISGGRISTSVSGDMKGDLAIIDSVGGGKLTNSGSQTMQASNGSVITIGAGATVSGDKFGILLNNGNLIVDGGTIEMPAGYAVYIYDQGGDNTATVEVKSGSIKSAKAGIYGAKNGDIKIYDGSIESDDVAIVLFDNAKLEIQGGNIKSNTRGAIETNGAESPNATINITGGNFVGGGGKYPVAYLPGGGKTTISGGTFEGCAGILVRGGTVELSNNVKIEATCEDDALVRMGNNKDVPAGAVIVDKDSGYNLGDVKINGGTFIGLVGYVNSSKGTELVSGDGTLVVKGGNFDDSLIGTGYLDTSLQAEIYSEIKNSDAPYSYQNDPTRAIKNLEEGETMTFVKHYREEVNKTAPLVMKAGYADLTIVSFQQNTFNSIKAVNNEYFTHPDGKDFIGWTLEGSDTLIKVGDTLDFSADGVTLIAQWEADKTALEEAIEAAEALNEDDYTASTWDALQEALDNANDVDADEDAIQKIVDEAETALREAIDALVSIAELRDAIADAEGVAKNNYTPSTVAPFEEAIEEAKAVLENDSATQEDVDNAIKVLEEAKNALKKVANKTELKNAITDAEALNEDDYTPNSWAESGIEEALEHAKDVKADPEVTQEEADEAAAALREAISKLVERADFSELEDAVNSALEAVAKAEETGDYTDESVEALIEALLEALETLDNPNASQEDVDAATQAILDAIAGLEKVEQPIELPSVPKTNDDIVNWVLMMATSVSVLTMLGYGAFAAKAKAKASKK